MQYYIGQTIYEITSQHKRNGSPRATIETNEERSYFLIDIPCHPDFIESTIRLNNEEQTTDHDTNNATVNVTEETFAQLTERQQLVTHRLLASSMYDVTVNVTVNVTETASTLARYFGVADRTIKRDLAVLQDAGVIAHTGPDKGGSWVIHYNPKKK